MALSKYEKVLKHLHIIEEKYGSIMNVPEKDEHFMAIKRIYPPGSALGGSVRLRLRNAKRLIKFGYPIGHVSCRTGLSDDTLKEFCRENCIEVKKRFKYIVCSPDHKIIYLDSIVDFVAKTFNREKLTIKQSFRYLEDREWWVKDKITYWGNVPLDVHFQLIHMDKPVKKVNQDSYVFENSFVCE